MNVWMILLLISLVAAPFDALYMHIKAGRRREKRREEEKANKSK